MFVIYGIYIAICYHVFFLKEYLSVIIFGKMIDKHSPLLDSKKMHEIPKRLLTALFCVVYSLLLKRYNIYTLCIYYTTGAVLCLYEYHYKMDSTRKKITIILSLIIYLMGIGYILDCVDTKYLSLILPIIMSLFSIELFSGKKNPMLSIGTDLIGIVWICVPILLCILMSYPYSETGRYHDPRIVYGIMIFVFMNDGGAYFVGNAFGKTKLFPSISPKKTWEGSIGGAITSAMCYFPISTYLDILKPNQWFVVMVMSILFGSIGDLIESMFKRDLKIKDTGTVLPGHGGILDRIDSLLYCVPFIYTYLVIIGKV